ncbi:rho GTPase-activating protein 31 isoform X2 [Pristis pectinata]|uniref:rho GTPase-activating protein 31 isoform X2 n=1 Tax=Pristis pectinata TaxID=685728 RepID=UPI00223DE54F|nr:rho GTPase-activating protein 31 isoform X2 [Pristis pectinata]
MKNKAAKQKAKRKGAKDTAFGCDLGEHLQNSNQDVPQVLKSCAEFIEKHGIVDGVYRLSGITSNIQRLRQEFGTEQRPDLTKEVYLQDIHCVGSLCKLYFRELPNPLLTYELYKKFTEAVTAQSEEEQLVRIQNVIKELPPPHYRTLEYLSKHLTHIASFSTKTNMHSRNLALVWAPNLLRSKEIEGSGYNNDAAFLEVRVQSIVIEFILNHVNQLFNSNTAQPKQDTEAHNPVAKCKSLPIVSPSMKLLSLEEAQARTLKPDHPARLEKIHCAPMDTGPAAGTIYHTVIDLPDPRRKLSAKTKKWKSIFNLGRLGNDSKGKLSRNGSVFVRAPQFAEKGNIRPAKSMESLCSLPIEDEEDIEKAGLKTEPLVVSTNSSSQNQPKLSLNPTHQDSDALQPLSSSESVTTSSVSPKPFESTEPEEVPPSIVPSTGRPCEDEHQRPCSGSNEEQPATKQDTDSSAKLSMEHLWPHTKELKIIEPEEITGPHIFLEKMEENLVQSRDDSHIEYTPLPDASTAVNTTGQQRMHSLPNLFLQSSPLMVETVPEEMSLNATSNKCSSEGNSTKTPDQSQAQQIKSMGSLLSASSKMELKHPITDKNILKALTESSPTECFGASVDSSQLIDTNSDVKDQYLIASHEFQSSEPCINKPEPNSKIDIKFSKLCSDVSNKSDQEEQLADISSNLKSEALPTDTSEPGIPGKHWMDNDTLKQPSSLSLQLVEVKNDEEECLAKISPDVRPDEWQYAAQELWSPDACTDKLAPEEHYDMSSQSVNKIVWNSQSPETPLPICNGESLSNSSLVIKSVNFLREMEGTSIHQQRTISPAEENSIASSKLDGLHVVSTGTTPCLESINVESTVVTPDRTEADCFKSEDKAPIVASYSTVNNKPSVSDGSPVQSIPVGVTAVRTTYMIKMCQVKAIPVIPPKVQFTQVPQPLPKKNLTPPSLPLDKVLTILQPVAVCEPSCPDSKQRLDSSLTNSSVAEPEDGKENGLPKSQTPEHGWCTISPDISLTQSKTSQAAPVVKKTSKANGEDLLDSPSPLRMERSAVQQKPAFTRHAQHRSKASRPQSLILFSPPWPSMERPSPVEPSKVPLSPVKSSPEPQTPEPDHPTPSSYSHELTDSQKGLEGVTLRNHMSMPKSGQRLETSTSCFYQPQRRSMIFENRGGRQIE